MRFTAITEHNIQLVHIIDCNNSELLRNAFHIKQRMGIEWSGSIKSKDSDEGDKKITYISRKRKTNFFVLPHYDFLSNIIFFT